MKVLHILNEIKFSGAEVMLKLAGSSFINDGIALYVLSTGDKVGEYAGEFEDTGYRVDHIPFRKSLSYFGDLYGFLVRERFDVVHIHAERAFFWHALTAKLAGVRIILRTVHSVFLFSGLLRSKRMIQRFVARFILGVKFIAIGPSVEQVEKRIFHNTTVLVPNWIDQDRFYPAEDENERNWLRAKFGIYPTDMVIISIGSCSEIKNHSAVIVAVAEVAKEFNNVVYLHIGEGPLLQNEMALAKVKGISEITRFLGQIVDVRDALVMGDIFVMTSKYEGMGNATLEAMSCGLPVIVYNVYGLRDVVENGKNGLLIEPNPDALAKAIKELALDEKLRKRMGVEGRNSVLRNFRMQESLERLLKLYRGERVV